MRRALQQSLVWPPMQTFHQLAVSCLALTLALVLGAQASHVPSIVGPNVCGECVAAPPVGGRAGRPPGPAPNPTNASAPEPVNTASLSVELAWSRWKMHLAWVQSAEEREGRVGARCNILSPFPGRYTGHGWRLRCGSALVGAGRAGGAPARHTSGFCFGPALFRPNL